jgi:hypothetical protein
MKLCWSRGGGSDVRVGPTCHSAGARDFYRPDSSRTRKTANIFCFFQGCVRQCVGPAAEDRSATAQCYISQPVTSGTRATNRDEEDDTPYVEDDDVRYLIMINHRSSKRLDSLPFSSLQTEKGSSINLLSCRVKRSIGESYIQSSGRKGSTDFSSCNCEISACRYARGPGAD